MGMISLTLFVQVAEKRKRDIAIFLSGLFQLAEEIAHSGIPILTSGTAQPRVPPRSLEYYNQCCHPQPHQNYLAGSCSVKASWCGSDSIYRTEFIFILHFDASPAPQHWLHHPNLHPPVSATFLSIASPWNWTVRYRRLLCHSFHFLIFEPFKADFLLFFLLFAALNLADSIFIYFLRKITIFFSCSNFNKPLVTLSIVYRSGLHVLSSVAPWRGGDFYPHPEA
jgi:hypothetical protein